ncbi:PaaI family thioesterase [Frankia sp. ACN1ag]|uniref:PaaI family thioesterase n=1 Tax=Frankia sp. ACN1ag TaxID=102891 RepID=UPI0006DCE88A|nr:PaaI family thioesterase [Frankia sp. ACN1ag]KQC35167.1 thioesterase [Frankia sp. ACN1ag]
MTAPELPWAVLADYRCFGCSPHNPHGLALEFAEHPEGLQTTFDLGRSYESYPGVVHGGLLGVVCDETMGNLIVVRTGLVAFTVSMRTRYLAPVATGRSYTCVARLGAGSAGGAGGAAGSPLISATAEIIDADGVGVVSASATYRNVPFGTARERIALTNPEADRLHQALSPTPAPLPTPALSTAPAPSSTPDGPVPVEETL